MDTTSAASAAPPSLLLPFCQYLLYRVRSDNLELLKRIVSEFLSEPRCTTTIQSMLQLAFPMIAILPVDNDDDTQRAQASAILHRMASLSHVELVRGTRAFRNLRSALSDQIELKNWDRLSQIFDDFCVGDETSLREFVQLQRQAIVVLPVQPLGSVQPPSDGEATPVDRYHTRLNGIQEAPSSERRADSKTRSHSTGVSVTLRRRNTSATTAKFRISMCDTKTTGRNYHGQLTDTKRAHRLQIYHEIEAIEANKPWEQVFDVSRIQYPFNARRYPDLAYNLRQFWRRHARAVWERPFWYRFPSHHSINSHIRVLRQEGAVRAFESLIIAPAFELLGPQFFVDLDRRAERHPWWWYRRPSVNILTMGAACGRDTCLAYLRTDSTKRFPNPPPGFEVRYERHSSEVTSMWSQKARFHDLAIAIAQLKHTTTSSTTTTAPMIKMETEDEESASDWEMGDD